MKFSSENGFSLVEVNLAVFVVAAGLLVIFSLFPLGLHESELSVAETQEAMFADYVLSTLEGNAESITNAAVWQNDTQFLDCIRSNTDVQARGAVIQIGTQVGPVLWPMQALGNRDNYLKYFVTIYNYPSWYRKKVTLSVKSGRYGSAIEGRTYVMDLVFLGM
jgi:Tfp pilus assembly protein PilV